MDGAAGQDALTGRAGLPGRARADQRVAGQPAAAVNVGDTVRARLGDRERIVKVVRLPGSRVSAELAAACLIDRSPPPPQDPFAGLGYRYRGAGRPSKRDRRRLDQARGRRA